jgi:3-hydroxyisobutyrate dehydrogenase
MAGRLHSQGVDLSVWNRTAAKSENLGLAIAASPAELISRCEIVFLNLFDSVAVDSVLRQPNGLLAGDCRGKLVVDTTTNHFLTVSSFYDLFAERGAAYLESPVLGTVVPAMQGNLTALVSGEQAALDSARPYLEKLAKRIFYLPERTLATKMKLVNNLVLGSFMTTIAEATALGEAVGVDRETILEILASGAGNSTVLNGKREMLIKQDFTPQFSLGAIDKDLKYLQDLAAQLRQPLRSGEAAREAFAKAVAENPPDLDFAAVYNIYRKH